MGSEWCGASGWCKASGGAGLQGSAGLREVQGFKVVQLSNLCWVSRFLQSFMVMLGVQGGVVAERCKVGCCKVGWCKPEQCKAVWCKTVEAVRGCTKQGSCKAR
jgi:hypothetical protein